MDDKITIRRANSGDLENILNLTAKLCENEEKNFYKGWNTNWVYNQGREIVSAGLNADDNFILIAESNSCPVAFLRASLYWDDWMAWKKGRGAELWDIYVEDGFRNKSMGKRMMEMFLAWCKEKQVDYIQLNVTAANTEAAKFYESLGFDAHQIIMEKRFK